MATNDLSTALNPNYSLVNLTNGMPEDEIHKAMQHARLYFQTMSSKFAGYQVNLDLDYEDLFEFMNFSLNNAGDPFIDSNYGVNSRMMERPVLEFCAELFHALDKNYWGYITSGSTESNMYAAHVGRSVLEFSSNSSRSGTVPQPIVYFSDATHYSVPKTAEILRIRSQVVPTNHTGAIDVPELMSAILKNDPVTHPPFIFANFGTSFTCAYDDVEEIVAQFEKYNIEKYYIHVDAALGGFFMPFLEGERDIKERVPIFDFRLPIDSISVSGHKAIGTPFPCGILLTLRHNLAYGGSKQEEIIGDRRLDAFRLPKWSGRCRALVCYR